MHRRLAESGRTAQLAAAHRQAAGYWHARTATPELGPRAQLEAAHHLRQAGDLAAHAAVAAPVETGPDTRRHLRRLGLASLAGFTAAFLAVEAANGFFTSHLTSPSSGRSARPSSRPGPACPGPR